MLTCADRLDGSACMLTAPLPSNEAERLAALRRYGIVDSPPEESFDRLTFVVKTILSTPAATVTFVDSDRQFFKARAGVSVTQTPRDIAFCAHTILGAEPLVVLDAARDERFHDSPLVTGPEGVRFYAAAPISTPDGFNIGAVCAIDFRPHDVPPTPQQLESLSKLAAMAADELELRRAVSELGEALDRRCAAEQAHMLSEQRLKDYLDTATDWLWETDENHRFVRILADDRIPFGEVPFLGRTRLERAHANPSDPLWAAHLEDLAARRPFRLFRYPVTDPAGQVIHVSVSGKPLFDPDGTFRGYRGTGRNITALVETEAAMHDLGRRLSILSASGIIGMMVCRGDRLVEANDELLRIIGYDRSDLAAGLSWPDLQPAGHPDAASPIFTAPAAGVDLPATRAKFTDTECLHKDGRWVPVSINWVSLDADKRMALVKDIRERKAAEEHIRELAFRDGLTGLLNRRSFIEELARRIASRDPRDNAGAVLMVDLDYFKSVNDSLGHDVGDALLQRIGAELRAVVGQTDVVARLGGDEFVVALAGFADQREVRVTAQRIVEACQTVPREFGCPRHAGASVGVAMYPADGTDPNGLLKSADLALYRAKTDGRCLVRFFDREQR
jgi:diguanylate cyclase (GGDEF)-like protein/PAS domain S-box-containing protein